MGAAITKTVDLALYIKELVGDSLETAVNTGTVELIDELVPLF